MEGVNNINTSQKISKKITSRNRQDTRRVLGITMILLGVFIILNSTGLFNYIFLLEIYRPFFLPILFIAVGIFIICKRGVLSGEDEKPSYTLYRSSKNKRLAGVCGGLAEYLKIDPSILRMIWLLFTFVTIGLGVFIYLLFALIIPKQTLSEIEE